MSQVKTQDNPGRDESDRVTLAEYVDRYDPERVYLRSSANSGTGKFHAEPDCPHLVDVRSTDKPPGVLFDDMVLCWRCHEYSTDFEEPDTITHESQRA